MGLPLSISKKMIDFHDINPFDNDLEIGPLLEYAKKAAKTSTNIRNFEYPEKEAKQYDELSKNAMSYRQNIAKHATKNPALTANTDTVVPVPAVPAAS